MNELSEPAAHAAPPHPDGFVSYSRRDRDAVLPIVRAAEAMDRSLWFDGDDIPGASVWRDELAEAIERADAFICFLSPSWLSSTECQREYERARQLGKRLVPVLVLDTPDPPDELAALQWIDARNPASPQQVASAVLAAIDIDHEWLREHTLWVSRALRWETGGSDRSRLLRGKDLDAAETWLAKGGDPPPTPLQQRFIAAGRQAERRRLRLIATAALVTVAVTLALAGAAVLQWRRADTEADAARRQTAIAEAQLAATRSTAAGTVWAALAFAVEAELRTPEPLPEARSVLAAALERLARQPARPQGLMTVPDIHVAAWSPTEPLLLTGSFGAVQLWDMPGRTPHGAPKEIMDSVDMIDWAPTGNLLAAVGYEDLHEVVKIFSVADDSPPSVIYQDMPGLVSRLAWSPDGARLAIGGGAGVRLFDTATRQLLEAPAIPAKDPDAITWSPDGRLLALLTDDGVVQLYDANSGAPTGPPLANRDARVATLAWSPTGTRLAGLTLDRNLLLWDVPSTTAAQSPVRGYGGTFRSLQWSPDGSTVASIDVGSALRLWDGRTGGQLGDPVQSNAVQLWDLGWSADGSQLAASGMDDTLRFYAPTVDPPLRLLEREEVKSVTWSPNGDRLVAAGKNGTVHIFDADTGAAVGAPITPTPVAEIRAVAWSPGGDRLATASGRDPVRIWDARTGEQVGSLAGSRLSNDVVWSPDGTRLAADIVGIGGVRIWDATTGQPVLDLNGTFLTRKVAWSPDGRWLATAAENTLQIWDAHTGQPHGPRLDRHEAQVQDISWSPDSTRVASSALDATMRRWDVASGTAIGEPTAMQDRTGAVGVTHVRDVAWSPSGTEIATGDSDGKLRLWSAATGAPVGEPIDTEHFVMSVAWSPGGHRIAVGGLSGVRIWESITERMACRFALDALGPEGLQAIVGATATPLRCADPDSVTETSPLPVLPARGAGPQSSPSAPAQVEPTEPPAPPDQASLDEFVRQQRATSLSRYVAAMLIIDNRSVIDVECPDGVADQVGASQRCELHTESGDKYGVTVTRVAGEENLKIEVDNAPR